MHSRSGGRTRSALAIEIHNNRMLDWDKIQLRISHSPTKLATLQGVPRNGLPKKKKRAQHLLPEFVEFDGVTLVSF